MDLMNTDTRALWGRYLATRSNEYRSALVAHYTPMVQMQTAVWAYGLRGRGQGDGDVRPFDGLAQPAAEAMFLPFVPPDAPWGVMP
ncbi:MAG TPA: hypothetical protein VLM89_01140 [Phycisphaerae bacterium]|nr:hypothetical protein [Phycisphaerae bacterium]